MANIRELMKQEKLRRENKKLNLQQPNTQQKPYFSSFKASSIPSNTSEPSITKLDNKISISTSSLLDTESVSFESPDNSLLLQNFHIKLNPSMLKHQNFNIPTDGLNNSDFYSHNKNIKEDNIHLKVLNSKDLLSRKSASLNLSSSFTKDSVKSLSPSISLPEDFFDTDILKDYEDNDFNINDDTHNNNKKNKADSFFKKEQTDDSSTSTKITKETDNSSSNLNKDLDKDHLHDSINASATEWEYEIIEPNLKNHFQFSENKKENSVIETQNYSKFSISDSTSKLNGKTNEFKVQTNVIINKEKMENIHQIKNESNKETDSLFQNITNSSKKVSINQNFLPFLENLEELKEFQHYQPLDTIYHSLLGEEEKLEKPLTFTSDHNLQISSDKTDLEHKDLTKIPLNLPIGFFDDEDADAEVRGLDGPTKLKKKNMEKNFQKFTTLMDVELLKTNISQSLIDASQHEQALQEDISKQNLLCKRLYQLKQKRTDLTGKKRKYDINNSFSSKNETMSYESDDNEIDEFDWRSKHIF